METTDIYFMAWLEHVKGIQFNDCKLVKRNCFMYHYDIPEDEWKTLKKEFVRSETAGIKSVHIKIKDLFY